MTKKPVRTFKTALRTIRTSQNVSLQELGLRIDSDASHVFKIERGQDVTLSTVLKLAKALGVTVEFGPFAVKLDPATKTRAKRVRARNASKP